MRRDDFDLNDGYIERPKKKKKRPATYDDLSYDRSMQGRQSRSGTTRHRKMSKKQKKKELLHAILPPIIAIILIAIVAAVALTTGALDSLKYSSKTANLYSYLEQPDDSAALIITYKEVTGDKIPVFDGKPYVALSEVNKEFHDRFYYDTESDSYLYTRADSYDQARIGDKSVTYKGSKKDLECDAILVDGDTVYIALDYLMLYKKLSYRIYGGDGEPYRMWLSLYEDAGSIKKDTVKKAQAVRAAEDKKSDIVKDLKVGDSVIVIDKGKEWSKVETEDLLIGYIENRYLTGSPTEESTGIAPDEGSNEDLGIVSNSFGEPVILAWHNVVNSSGEDDIAGILGRSQGINVISPTWFTVVDDNANIDSIGSKAYVDLCHAAGVKVWGLFDNLQHLEVSSFEIFSKASKREKLISQLIAYAKEYGLDGINIDVESIPVESGVHFAQFIRELSMVCRNEGIILSVDNYVPKDFNDHYNRYEQGVYADYVIIMGYDEHYSGSPIAGSVASIDFVKSGIENTIEMVPSSKVINAVPLYTRLWIETPKTDEEIANEMNTTDDDGNEIHVNEEDIVPYNLEVQTIRMSEGREAAAANAEITWDEETKQNYATWEKGGKTYEIWLEDKDSLAAKLDVMKENNLAGVAAWQVNYAEDFVWELFKEYY